MKATELRYGNIVSNRKKKPVVVDNIILSQLEQWDRTHYSKTAPLKPISLTEEWLLKFGFKKYNNAWMLEEPRKRGYFYFPFSIWRDLSYNTAEIKPPLDYVHQLQNLYFALTGEELIIQP